MSLFIGTILYGYCNGYFGKSYNDKRIEAIGCDWVVVRSEDGYALFGDFKDTEEMIEKIDQWSNPNEINPNSSNDDSPDGRPQS